MAAGPRPAHDPPSSSGAQCFLMPFYMYKLCFDFFLDVQLMCFFVALCLCRLPAARPRPALQQWRAFFLMPSYHQRQRQQHQQHRQRPQHPQQPQYLVVCVCWLSRVWLLCGSTSSHKLHNMQDAHGPLPLLTQHGPITASTWATMICTMCG